MTMLDGKIAVVTGGGRGLGFAIAKRLQAEGASLVIAGRDEGTLERAAATLRADGAEVLTCCVDVSKSSDVRRLVDQAVAWRGHIDIVVNNAGIADEASFEQIELDNWNRVVAVNLTAPFLLSQRAAAVMPAGGSIINIASVDAYAADGPFASYVATKAGLIGLTKAAAVELAPKGIRVNSVSPGWASTDMAIESTTPTMLKHMRSDFARVPLRRLVTPEEVAHAVYFLASPNASAITGSDIAVDGGTLANLYILETLPEEE